MKLFSRYASLTAAILILAALLSLVSCNTEQSVQQYGVKSRIFYDYFNANASTIYDYSGGSNQSFNENVSLFRSLLEYYHELFDIYYEYEGVTNLATVNRLAKDGAVKVDGELISFLEYAVEMHTLTRGNMNIAIGSVLSIWHDYRTIGREVPSAEILAAAAEHTDINNLVIDKENSTVRFLDPEMKLDVGAIAKGYAVERIAQQLIVNGASSYVIDVGGNLRIIGEKPDGGSWETAILNPDIYSDERYIYKMQVKDTAVVTSGDYQRFYIVDGVKYHHIINKDTLMPADYFSSVTIVTKNSGLADALSTALFNMSYEDGVELVTSIGDISVVWVTKNGEVLKHGI